MGTEMVAFLDFSGLDCLVCLAEKGGNPESKRRSCATSVDAINLADLSAELRLQFGAHFRVPRANIFSDSVLRP